MSRVVLGFSMQSKLFFILLVLFVGVWGGCSGSDTPGDGSLDGTVTDKGYSKIPAGTIRGTVSYTGTQTGSLIVGFYQSCQPLGPPIDMIMAKFDNPTFPQAFELKGITNVGEFMVAAIYDIGKNNPTMPGPEDLVVCSAKFTLTASEGAQTTVSLVDK